MYSRGPLSPGLQLHAIWANVCKCVRMLLDNLHLLDVLGMSEILQGVCMLCQLWSTLAPFVKGCVGTPSLIEAMGGASCAVLPVYATGPRVKRNPGVTFGAFTMSNLELNSSLYWCGSLSPCLTQSVHALMCIVSVTSHTVSSAVS